MTQASVRIVTRADDAGLCVAANCAVVECALRGITRNISVMVPGPAFEDAAKRLRDLPNVALGLHVTLNCEWETVRWGPVLPASRVPTLVDVHGYLHSTPHVLLARGFSLDEAIEEVASQLDLARQHGLNIAYLDEHMGVGWIGGLRARLDQFAQEQGLLITHAVPNLPRPREAGLSPLDRLLKGLEQAQHGDYVHITHPAYADEQMRRLNGRGQVPGLVARERDAERQLLQDPRVMELFTNRRLAAVRYSDLIATPAMA